jgi:hypothetical protein
MISISLRFAGKFEREKPFSGDIARGPAVNILKLLIDF